MKYEHFLEKRVRKNATGQSSFLKEDVRPPWWQECKLFLKYLLQSWMEEVCGAVKLTEWSPGSPDDGDAPDTWNGELWLVSSDHVTWALVSDWSTHLHDLGLGERGVEGGVDVVVHHTLTVEVNPRLRISLSGGSRLLDLGSVEATQPEDHEHEAAGDTEAEAQAQHQGQLPGIRLKYGGGVNYMRLYLLLTTNSIH